MIDYTYSISGDFPNQKVSPDKLKAEIVANPGIATPLTGVSTLGDVCTITFSDTLSPSSKTALDGAVAAHDGVDVTVDFKIASTIIGQAIDIVETTAWQDLGGVAVNVAFYCPDLDKASAIVEYGVKATGSGAQLRVIEVDDDGNFVVMSDEIPIADSSGGWKVAKFQTNHPPAQGDRTFILQGRLNSASAAAVRFASFVLIRVTVS